MSCLTSCRNVLQLRYESDRRWPPGFVLVWCPLHDRWAPQTTAAWEHMLADRTTESLDHCQNCKVAIERGGELLCPRCLPNEASFWDAFFSGLAAQNEGERERARS